MISSLALLFFSCNQSYHSEYLKQGFINPPDSARPGAYWYFMDGNLDRKAMTSDLESMKKAGIGYVLFLEVNVGVPRGKTDLLSDEWQELFTHAVRECERLGIRLIMGSGPGWAGSGGPWVEPSQSMMHLVTSDTLVKGPLSFNCKLPVPEPKKPFFGEGSLTPSLRELRDNWYEDVFVLAFPTPVNPLKISQIDEKALYYRAPFTSQAGVLPFLLPDIQEVTRGSSIDRKTIIDITDHLQKNGILEWEVPAGRWTIMRFGKRNNGAVTRPAPQPGLGFECDKFDTAAFDAHYDNYIGKLIRKASPRKTKSGGGWTMIHIDSWEMGSQNWSPHFREEFIKRRGYDPLIFLPVYSGLTVENNELSERFLWDVRQTSNELIIEKHALHCKALGRKNGFRLSVEPYDMNPASDLDLGSTADVPMCEFWSEGFGFNSAFSCIEGTSIAHVTGAPVVAAEAFTADSREAWKKYPGDMKNQGDWAFCMGINRLVYHTFAHKPYGDNLRPGVTMGPYGVHWDCGQTWWPMADGYHKYITRCQYILSQGKPVADMLYLAPEGAPHVFRPPSSALSGTDFMPDKKGYSFDGCSPDYFINYATVKDGKVVFPGGASYNIMVLPQVRAMTPALLEKVRLLAEAGATIIGNPPEESPSLSGYPKCDENVKKLVYEIWGNEEIPFLITTRNLGNGNILWGKIINNSHRGIPGDPDSLTIYPDYDITRSILEVKGIFPDFSSPGGKIRYTHQSLLDKEIYFVSNVTGLDIADECSFRDGSPDAEFWDAVTGEIRPVKVSYYNEGYSTVLMKLSAWQSMFVIFNKTSEEKTEKYKDTKNFPDKQILMKLDGPWNVAFDTAWGGPASIEFNTLSDWSKRPEDGIRFYSGIALYSKTFDLPASLSSVNKSDIYLNLGKVMNLARVKLNGKDLGVVWTAPWEVNITDAVKKKNNRLEIEVANLWINRLIGDESMPWDGIEKDKWPEWLLNSTTRPTKRYTFTTHRYYKANDPLVESGLIGPVTLTLSK